MKQRTGVTAAGALGAAATILLHSLFFAAVLWGGTRTSRLPDTPDAVGTGANYGRADSDVPERRMIVRLLSEVDAGPLPAPPDTHLDEHIREALKVEITGPDSLPLPPLLVGTAEPAESSAAELMARAKMMGVYESQVRARIQRAWNLPGGTPPGNTFICRALIRQRRDGRVSEVELPYEGCEGTPALRQSLVNAIFAASPLPAPPHPGVFVDSFSMEFRSDAAR